MRTAALLLLIAGCTRHNGLMTIVCTPGEQRQCACVGGSMGVQICNPLGNGLGECIGCPGSIDMSRPELPDLAGADLSVTPAADLAGADLAGADFAGADLTGSADDLSAVVEDMAMSLPDLSVIPDLAGVDLAGIAPTPCPVVMLVLDTSASMGTNFTSSATSHLGAGQQAMDFVVDNYGKFVPLGFTHFANESGTCSEGITVSPEPKTRSTGLKPAINATVANGSGNLGNAVGVIAADTNMHQAGRPGSFMIIYTDGAGNCESTEPAFSVTQIDTAAKAAPPIKTYIVAVEPETMFSSDEQQMTLMANAGQRQCGGGYCGGHTYWPAVDVPHATQTLDLILNEIVQSVPGGCGGFACFPSGLPCAAGTSCCGTAGCKNLGNDSENCGSCGASCGGGTCSGGVCHCGGMTCPAGDHCVNGACLSSLDMAPPPPCVCNPACTFGNCVAANCCTDVGGCNPTPQLCSCVPGAFGGC
jgi:Pentapeptide repeats (8 copies)